MPKIPIDECPAGPAMDMAVAEALGWHIEFWQDGADGGCELCDEEGNHVRPWSYDPSPRWRWSPSTDIAAAWEFAPGILNGKHLVFMGTHWAIWHFDGYDNMPNDAVGETAPLTICRALLKANGVEHMEVPGDGD